nr:unnamed protein product [Callosobruchus analis]
MKSWDTQQFFEYTRMNVQVFETLLVKIIESIPKQTRSDGISAGERLVITLHHKHLVCNRYLSQETTMQILAWNFHIGHQIIHETCQAVWDHLKKDDLNTPKGTKLLHSIVLVPYSFVADEAFSLRQFIMRPYSGKNLTIQQKVFNYHLSRARQTIENSFGILVA